MNLQLLKAFVTNQVFVHDVILYVTMFAALLPTTVPLTWSSLVAAAPAAASAAVRELMVVHNTNKVAAAQPPAQPPVKGA